MNEPVRRPRPVFDWSAAVIMILSIGSAILVFVQREAFDEMHQKRLFIIHMENVRIPSSSPMLPSPPDPQICRFIRSRRAKTTCLLGARTLRLADGTSVDDLRSELLAAVTSAFEAKYSGTKAARAEKQTKADGAVTYELAFEKGGKKHEATFWEDGKFKEEE